MTTLQIKFFRWFEFNKKIINFYIASETWKNCLSTFQKRFTVLIYSQKIILLVQILTEIETGQKNHQNFLLKMNKT